MALAKAMSNDRALWFILATILIDAIGVGLIFPLMPDLMDRVGAGGASNGAVLGGILMAAYAATQFLCAPAVGGLSDAVGRKPVLLVALATLAIDYVIMALATSFWLLLVGRLLAGVAGATYITATAYLADDVTAPFWVAAALSAANVAFGLAVLPESLAPAKRRAFRASDLNPFGAIRDAFRMPALALPLACMFVFEFANMVYPTLWAFWGREAFGWSATMIGGTLAAYGVGVALTQGLVLPALLKRMSEHGVLTFALLTGTVAAFAFGFTTAPWLVAVILPIACLSDMAPPTLTAIMANATDEDRQGVLQGVIASLGSLAAIFAPLLMTPLFRHYTGPDTPFHMPGAPFLFAGFLMLLIFPVVNRIRLRTETASGA